MREGYAPMHSILKVIKDAAGLDLSLYKRSSIERSINRRMRACGVQNLSDYASLLVGDTNELHALVSDVTVEFSFFFRDEELFHLLRGTILPDLVRKRKAASEGTIRVWCAGCGAGEEAYSVAILLFETLKGSIRRNNVTIFATDVDPSSVAKSRAGIYSAESIKNLTSATLERYFSFDGSYHIRDFIKNLICFGKHDLLSNPPISRIDLLSCRNVLIYLDKEGQSAVLKKLRYALRPGGYLVLGKSESLSQQVTNSFCVVDRACKVFQRKEDDTCLLSCQ
jgi:two-component system CheB/CheR fusion protein